MFVGATAALAFFEGQLYVLPLTCLGRCSVAAVCYHDAVDWGDIPYHNETTTLPLIISAGTKKDALNADTNERVPKNRRSDAS